MCTSGSNASYHTKALIDSRVSSYMQRNMISLTSNSSRIHISNINLAEQMLKRLVDLVKKLKALASMHAVDSQ